jgi:hypothetical protein
MIPLFDAINWLQLDCSNSLRLTQAATDQMNSIT